MQQPGCQYSTDNTMKQEFLLYKLIHMYYIQKKYIKKNLELHMKLTKYSDWNAKFVIAKLDDNSYSIMPGIRTTKFLLPYLHN